MTPWEAIHGRFGVDEESFRESQDKQRELIAFWVEAGDTGGYGVRGIDHWNSGGIDEIVDLNSRFLRAFLDCIEADQVGGKVAGPFIDAKIIAEASFRGTRQLQRDRQGVIYPTKKFEKCHANIDDPWQVEFLPPLVRWVLDCKATAFDRPRDSGGGYLCKSEWTHVFVCAKDPVEARCHIEARLSEAREVLATWVVKS
ncbi:MAG: hypothetical protein RL689_2164 [Planctomycetota bacterium]|jgi:hypothetical protein